MTDRFEELRTFTTVIAAGGIKAAAAELGIVKSAVSRRVSELEERLGRTLIVRTTRSFQPTPEGVDFFHRAKAVLDALADLDAPAPPPLPRRHLTISAPLPVITHILPDALKDASEVLDHVTLSFFDSERLHRDLDEADITVAFEEVADRTNRLLASTVIITCASPAYLLAHGSPVAPDDLHHHRVISVAQPPAQAVASETPPAGGAPASMVMPDLQSAAAAAVAGLGVAQLPDFVVTRAIENGDLVAVLKNYAGPPTRLVASSSRDADPLILAVMNILGKVRPTSGVS